MERGLYLAQLGLVPEEVLALRKQGFVSGEKRGPGHTCYKLRFRFAGRQRVRALGGDAAVAERVRQELAELQASTRLDRELAQLTRKAKRMLREARQRLEPLLREEGFAFHGLAVRRKGSKETLQSKKSTPLLKEKAD
jgi:hypothetical protein